MRDQKTQNRINKHLKVCKAANKSVLVDAVDNENTAVTLAGMYFGFLWIYSYKYLVIKILKVVFYLQELRNVIKMIDVFFITSNKVSWDFLIISK